MTLLSTRPREFRRTNSFICPHSIARRQQEKFDMVLDVNTQVGDQYATTDVHLFEVHGKTAGWGMGLILTLILVTCVVGRLCRRRYRRKLAKITATATATAYEGPKAITYEGPPKAITYEGPPRAIAFEAPPRAIAYEGPPRVFAYPAPRAAYCDRLHYPEIHRGTPRTVLPMEDEVEESGTSQTPRPRCTINM